MTKQIEKTELKNWLTEQAREQRVIAPQANGAGVYFGVFDDSKEVILDELPIIPAKTVLLPPSEELFTFKNTKLNISQERISITINDDLEKTLLFGVLPPDLKGLAVLEHSFSTLYQDPYYLKRLKNTTVISCSWHAEHEACFCNAFPNSLLGSDIEMFDFGSVFYLHGITDKGKKFLSSSNLRDADESDEEIQSQCSSQLEPKSGSLSFDISGIEDKIDSVFEGGLWLDLTKQCLGCGICTYLCPTCYCFDMFDEGCGSNCGKRMRTWDTCQEPKFTLEASGHNPRQKQYQRYRNRIYHKFKALKDKTGSYACTGCGRCVKHCPVGVDIREIVKRVCKE